MLGTSSATWTPLALMWDLKFDIYFHFVLY
jgi:hypothetical protein